MYIWTNSYQLHYITRLLTYIHKWFMYFFVFFQLFETSAKNDNDCDHVEAIFMTLAHKLKASKPMMPIDPTQFPPEDIHRAEVMSIGRERNGVEVQNTSSCYCWYTATPLWSNRNLPGKSALPNYLVLYVMVRGMYTLRQHQQGSQDWQDPFNGRRARPFKYFSISVWHLFYARYFCLPWILWVFTLCNSME